MPGTPLPGLKCSSERLVPNSIIGTVSCAQAAPLNIMIEMNSFVIFMIGETQVFAHSASTADVVFPTSGLHYCPSVSGTTPETVVAIAVARTVLIAGAPDETSTDICTRVFNGVRERAG